MLAPIGALYVMMHCYSSGFSCPQLCFGLKPVLDLVQQLYHRSTYHTCISYFSFKEERLLALWCLDVFIANICGTGVELIVFTRLVSFAHLLS